MSKQEGLFEVDGKFYTLKLNMQKVKQIESMLGVSFVSEIVKSGGMLSFSLLEAIFSLGLYHTEDERTVRGKKAQEIFNALLENEGYVSVAEVAIAKIEEDLGFLFQ